MKQTIKKGFTLVELLFVMAIISILAGFAIANLNDSTRVATVNSMKSDLRGAIIAQQTDFANSGTYTALTCDSAAATTVNGLCTNGNVKTAVSKGNKISVYFMSTNNVPGFRIQVDNSTYSSDHFSYDSALYGSIRPIALVAQP